jgi:hypothetical protein
MATIDLGFDVREIFSIILECNLDIGSCYVPNTKRYGLRFICTNVGILEYTDEEIMNVLNNLKEIILLKDKITEDQKKNIKNNIKTIALSRKMYI